MPIEDELMNNNSDYLIALLESDSKKIMEIYDNFFPKVKKHILNNRGNVSDAEDVFQKVLIQLAVRYRKEPFEIKSSFEGYLFVACSNIWTRELNKSKRLVTTELVMEPVDDTMDQTLALLEQKRWELFSECLTMISENCRKVLTMFFAKTSYDQIVEKFGYNSETVARQRVFKCKRKLSELIKKDKRYNSLKDL